MEIDIKEYRRLKRIEMLARRAIGRREQQRAIERGTKAKQFPGCGGPHFITNRVFHDLYAELWGDPATLGKEG